MAKVSHLSDNDLIRFADREMPQGAASAAEAHLQNCPPCRQRLDELQNTLTLYGDYHARILKPSLDSSSLAWPTMESLLAQADQPKKRFVFTPPLLWAQAAALALCLVLCGIYFYQTSQPRQMRRILARAAIVTESPHQRLRFTVDGRSWYRPAVLRPSVGKPIPDASHVEALFVKANYNWNNPLSARSFSAWRNRLRQKCDQVTALRGANGAKRFYRVQTQTPDGTLRTASLTLRADTFRPVQGSFQFDDRETVAIADAGEMPASPGPPKATPHTAAPAQKLVETKATPEDELRVFAALNSIGADAGEPVRVEIDPAKQHVVVTGMGLSPTRENQIRQALAGLSNTIARFESAPPPAQENEGNPNAYTSASSEPFRRALEQQAGGSPQLESITERALDASGTLLAQAHALFVLSQHFPPSVESNFTEQQQETLRVLRHRHAKAVEQAVLQLEEALKPLLAPRSDLSETPHPPDTSWQGGASRLFNLARALDQSVGRVMAAGYSPEAGQATLSKLPSEMENLETLARQQATAE